MVPQDVYIEAKGASFKYETDSPMSPLEMLYAMEKKGRLHVYILLNMGSTLQRYLIRLINPAKLVQQQELRYRLQLGNQRVSVVQLYPKT